MTVKKSTVQSVDSGIQIDPLSAERELREAVVHTPVRRLPWLEQLVGVEVWAKLEFQQHTGSFKYRGAHLATARGSGATVIAASAGNHGLAVAEAARRLGRPANICIPIVASRLKRERILATGAGLLEYGNSLEAATRHARQLAVEENLHYISPYNDTDVIAGASTVGLEFLRDVPETATMIVPIGGGGLVSGIGFAARALNREIKIIGCEPVRYASVTNSLAAGRIVRVTHQPTMADGLAVNLEPGSITYSLAQRFLDGTVCLTEEELAAATLAVLVHESLLVEPAGAAGIVACLRLAREGRLSGPVAIPLCGGNVQHSTLSKIERFPYSSDELIRLLDLRGRSVADTSVSWSRPGPATPLDVTRGGPEADLHAHLSECADELERSVADVDEFERYAELRELSVEPSLLRQLTDTARSAAALVSSRLASDDAGPAAEGRALSEATLRFGIATAAHVRSALEWCSPSYGQAAVSQFFDLGAQESPTVNYDRYESAATSRVENQLLSVLAAPPDEFGVIATSSGMAAYSLIEGFLLRERLTAGDTVLVAPYIYFEASEQLTSLPHIRCVRAPGYGTDEILDAVRVHRPRCLFIDPLANTAEQSMIDIAGVLAGLPTVLQGPITVVIDGTMVSGAIPFSTLRSTDQVEVFYYESCSKYMQLGMDASMAGLVACPVGLQPAFDRLRRNSGSILYRRSAFLFPRFDRAQLQRRMHRIGANALAVANSLHGQPEVSAAGQVYYPGHPAHPDFAIASRLSFAGGCVTFLFHDQGANHRNQLDAMLEIALDTAGKKGLLLTKGVSFGFSTPRISAAASMAESEPPFLRIYVGDPGAEQTALLAEVMAHAIAQS